MTTSNQASLLPTKPQSVATLNPDPLKQRIYLGGAPKTGKTTTASQWAPATTLFIDLQHGTDLLPGEHFVQHVDTWRQFEQVIDAIVAGGHRFTTIVIDTIDMAYKYADAQAGAKFGEVSAGSVDWGKGTNESEGLFRRCIGKLLACRDLGIWFIGHLELVEENKIQKWVPMLDKRVRGYVTGECQHILIAERIGNRTVVHTKASQRFEAGTRLDKYVPDTLDLDARVLYGALDAGIKALIADEGVEPEPESDADRAGTTDKEAVPA